MNHESPEEPRGLLSAGKTMAFCMQIYGFVMYILALLSGVGTIILIADEWDGAFIAGGFLGTVSALGTGIVSRYFGVWVALGSEVIVSTFVSVKYAEPGKECAAPKRVSALDELRRRPGKTIRVFKLDAAMIIAIAAAAIAIIAITGYGIRAMREADQRERNEWKVGSDKVDPDMDKVREEEAAMRARVRRGESTRGEEERRLARRIVELRQKRAAEEEKLRKLLRE